MSKRGNSPCDVSGDDTNSSLGILPDLDDLFADEPATWLVDLDESLCRFLESSSGYAQDESGGDSSLGIIHDLDDILGSAISILTEAENSVRFDQSGVSRRSGSSPGSPEISSDDSLGILYDLDSLLESTIADLSRIRHNKVEQPDVSIPSGFFASPRVEQPDVSIPSGFFATPRCEDPDISIPPGLFDTSKFDDVLNSINSIIDEIEDIQAPVIDNEDEWEDESPTQKSTVRCVPVHSTPGTSSARQRKRTEKRVHSVAGTGVPGTRPRKRVDKCASSYFRDRPTPRRRKRTNMYEYSDDESPRTHQSERAATPPQLPPVQCVPTQRATSPPRFPPPPRSPQPSTSAQARQAFAMPPQFPPVPCSPVAKSTPPAKFSPPAGSPPSTPQPSTSAQARSFSYWPQPSTSTCPPAEPCVLEPQPSTSTPHLPPTGSSFSFTTIEKTPHGTVCKKVRFSEEVSERIIPPRTELSESERMARYGTLLQPTKTASTYRLPPPKYYPNLCKATRSHEPQEPVYGPFGPLMYGSCRPPPKTCAGRLTSPITPLQTTTKKRSTSLPRCLPATQGTSQSSSSQARREPSQVKKTSTQVRSGPCHARSTSSQSRTVRARDTTRPAQTRSVPTHGGPAGGQATSGTVEQQCPSQSENIPDYGSNRPPPKTSAMARFHSSRSARRRYIRDPPPEPTGSQQLESSVSRVNDRIQRLEDQMFNQNPERCQGESSIPSEVREKFMDSFAKINQSMRQLEKLVKKKVTERSLGGSPHHQKADWQENIGHYSC